MTSTCRRRALGEPGCSYSRPVTNGVTQTCSTRGRGRRRAGAVTRPKSALTGQDAQVEENPVLVLFDLRRHFEECEDQRGGLRSGQWVCASVWVRVAWWGRT